MGVLAWWAIPAVATALALAWAAWASRSRPRADAYDTVDDYRRFRQALQDASDTEPRQQGFVRPVVPAAVRPPPYRAAPLAAADDKPHSHQPRRPEDEQ